MSKYDMLWRQSGVYQLSRNLLITKAVVLLGLSLVISLIQKLAESRISAEMVLALILFQAFVLACVFKGAHWARQLTMIAGAFGIWVFWLRLSFGMPGDMGTITMNAIESALDLSAILLLHRWEAKADGIASNAHKTTMAGTPVKNRTGHGFVGSGGGAATGRPGQARPASVASRCPERLAGMAGTAVALAAYVGDPSDDEWSGDFPSPDAFVAYINPANGLPMVGGIGGIDVAGNPYGLNSLQDHGHIAGINPASGLPMTDTHSSIDIAGNPYGEDFLSSSVGYDSSFGGGFDS